MIFIKESGIIRKIDELGRLVIPKEMRDNLKITTGDNIEIFLDENNNICLKKHSTLFGQEVELYNIAKVIYETTNATVIFSDTEKVLISYGEKSELYLDKPINKLFLYDIRNNDFYLMSKTFIIDNYEEVRNTYVFPLFAHNKLEGLFIMIENGKELKNIENEIALYFKKFILKQINN